MSKFQTEAVQKRFPLFFRVANHFRQKRVNFFLDYFSMEGEEAILDVGGEPYFWDSVPNVMHVTLLNLHKSEDTERVRSVAYSGGIFPFHDKQFDIVFSNSTIEHVGDFWDQEVFAQEVMRVGHHFFVQVPSYWFPYEPHAHTPFYQFFPAPIKILLRKIFPKSTYPIQELLSIRLLTKAELKILFPGARIYTERFLWILPKSYFVVDKVKRE